MNADVLMRPAAATEITLAERNAKRRKKRARGRAGPQGSLPFFGFFRFLRLYSLVLSVFNFVVRRTEESGSQAGADPFTLFTACHPSDSAASPLPTTAFQPPMNADERRCLYVIARSAATWQSSFFDREQSESRERRTGRSCPLHSLHTLSPFKPRGVAAALHTLSLFRLCGFAATDNRLSPTGSLLGFGGDAGFVVSVGDRLLMSRHGGRRDSGPIDRWRRTPTFFEKCT